MTLTIGIIAKDGVVLASDSRLSSDLFSNDTVDKIIKIGDNIAVGIAGDGTLGTHIFDLIKKEDKLKINEGIQSVAEDLSKKLSTFFDNYYPNKLPKDRTHLDILLVGYSLPPVSEAHIYNLCSIDNFIPRQSPTGHNAIGLPHIANYLLNGIYEDKITSDEAAKLSVYCIKETSSQYLNVGGEVKIATFSSTKSFAMIPKGELTKLESHCGDLKKFQKHRFYPEAGENESPL